MQVYRVGGAIRDRLLGLAVKDTDWVVTGSTPEQMAAEGYLPIGKDFPVFLHPKTKQEYALARTERKVSRGYAGFNFNTDPAISIEQDLARRDLTINAIAEDAQGTLIDPFNGQQDIQLRILRHVSDAFVEDPVRVLRVARFAARFAHLGFQIAEETKQLIGQIAQSGELDALVAERVWVEMDKALAEHDPQVFFTSLRDCGVLHTLFPEIDNLFGVPQTARYHPEVDTGIHVMLALKKSAELDHPNDVRFAVLTHDLGKATTAPNILPAHHGHEQRGIKLTRNFCRRWRVPKATSELAIMTCEFHTHIHRAYELKPATLLKLFTQTDCFRRSERFHKMTQACIADARGRTGYEQDPYPQAAYAWDLVQQLNALELTPVLSSDLKGKALGQAIYDYRLQFLKTIVQKVAP
ncbi:MAG: multifunctional CCA addition/repair protein [Gammaproteobacteria bacterium]|nr:multifunctional CCA addition/repair protein [Gammaproteobacteria bacterium]MBL6999179.1 multifunctional CCA addition/repair protein [Gammaproteobacteria bacterium]